MARNAVVNTLHRVWQQPLAEVDLNAYPRIHRHDRYRYTIDGRPVDFTAAVTPAEQAYPIS